MATMVGGTLLFEGAHLIDAIRTFAAKQANVVITPLFFQTQNKTKSSNVPPLTFDLKEKLWKGKNNFEKQRKKAKKQLKKTMIQAFLS